MAKSPKQPEAASIETLTFEQAVERLEAIITRMESGEIGLERSIAEYERGAALIKRCRAILDQAEQRVAELTASGEQPVRAKPAPGANSDRGAEDDDEAPF